MDMGISLHYDVCPEKKSSGQTLGLKTRSDCVGNYYHGHSFSSL